MREKVRSWNSFPNDDRHLVYNWRSLSHSFPNYPGENIGYEFIPSQSELFRFIAISVPEPVWIIPNQSEKRFVYGLMKNGEQSIRGRNDSD